MLFTGQNEQFENKSRVIIRSEFLEKETEIALTPLLSTVGKNNTYVSVLNVSEHPIAINIRTEVGRFSTISADQLIQIDPQSTPLAKLRNRDNHLAELNQLVQDVIQQKLNQTKRPHRNTVNFDSQHQKLVRTQAICHCYNIKLQSFKFPAAGGGRFTK